MSLAQSLAPDSGQINNSATIHSVICPTGHFLRVRFTLEVVVERLGHHPFKHFHQSIALHPSHPSAAIPSPKCDSEQSDRFEAQTTQLVSIQSNPESKLYTHTAHYSFCHRNSRPYRRMHFTWLSSASSHLWQFVPDAEPILSDVLAMRWMLGPPDIGGGSYENALLHAPVLFNQRNNVLAAEICRRSGAKLPSAPDNPKVQKAIDKVPNLYNSDYDRFDPFQFYCHLRIRQNVEDLRDDTGLLFPFDWKSFNEPIWLLSEH